MSFYNLFLFYISLGWVSFHSGNKGKIQCLLSLTVSKYILCVFFLYNVVVVQTTNIGGNVNGYIEMSQADEDQRTE